MYRIAQLRCDARNRSPLVTRRMVMLSQKEENEMLSAGEYSDALRALGWYLAKTDPLSIEIADRGTHWLVASSRGSETLFEKIDLEYLRREARHLREDGLNGEPQLT